MEEKEYASHTVQICYY